VVIADTSGLLALYNSKEPEHFNVKNALDGLQEPLVISPFVIAELDYLIADRIGIAAEATFLREIASGGYILPHLTESDIVICTEIIEKYSDQNIGIADASLVLLADRYNTNRILTLDRRHFSVLRPLRDAHFVILPVELS
jgi:uncharacterized protein